MIEAALVQELAKLLAPALPYLMRPVANVGQKAAEAISEKIGDANWKRAQQVWDKIKPWVDKKPEVAEALKEAADNPDDPIAMGALPRDLKRLLEAMPAQTVNEIQSIVSQRSETNVTAHADRGAVVIQGSSLDNSPITTHSGVPEK